MMTPHELIVAAGVAIAAAAYVCGSLAPWWRVLEWAHRDYLDEIHSCGYDDALAEFERDHKCGQTVMLDRFDSGSAAGGSAPADLDPGPRTPRPYPGHDWRADYAEQLAPAVLDAENLPGPDSLPAPRAGEHHRRAIVDLGQAGDDKMLTRDWFARRAFIDGLWRDDVGGFEITEHGHLVAVAA